MAPRRLLIAFCNQNRSPCLSESILEKLPMLHSSGQGEAMKPVLSQYLGGFVCKYYRKSFKWVASNHGRLHPGPVLSNTYRDENLMMDTTNNGYPLTCAPKEAYYQAINVLK